MDIQPVPGNAKTPFTRTVLFGPPKGVRGEDCGAAEVLVTPDGRGMGSIHSAYFKPSASDLDVLNGGGLVQIDLWGDGIQPFGCTVQS